MDPNARPDEIERACLDFFLGKTQEAPTFTIGHVLKLVLKIRDLEGKGLPMRQRGARPQK